MLKKVVVIGPESTGKSTLCELLAKHYQTKWCPEYAREFLLKNGTNYSYEDLLTVAKGQLAGEDKYVLNMKSQNPIAIGSKVETNADFHSPLTTQHADAFNQHSDGHRPDSLLFIDTEMYVMKVWCEFVFGNCHRFILDQIVQRKYDLYLLCNVDMPWIKDELREYPDLETRRKLYFIYKDIMINQSTPWVDISGGYEERLQKAIEAVDKL
ncbi:AAA family ATPase [Terrimonas pollutisoli]|uniref:AAA family ATPase n=1 Tax=Terrimonas pollutisoli TaxID=3034147 RepID=UPI0023EAE318|nr:AAA family ATPase [Terrimonas sp. H1YJ31]